MYNVFKKFTRPSASASVNKRSVPSDYHLPLSAEKLLASPERQRNLQILWDSVALPAEAYQFYYLRPLEQCVEFMQCFPYAPSGPYARHGGMIDMTLELLTRAVRLSKQRMLPLGASPEQQAAQNTAWNGVVFYAALMSSLAPLCRFVVELQNGQNWSPLDGPLNEPYRFRFPSALSPDREQALASVLACRMLPQEVITWLQSSPDAMEALAFYLLGVKHQSGGISSILEEATSGVLMSDKQASLSKIIDDSTPRALHVQDQNQLCKLQQETVNNTGGNRKVESTQHKLQKSHLGNVFWQWLKQGCCTERLAINTPQGNIHLVAGFVFLRTPGIFYQFLSEQALSPELKPQLQKAFEKLGLHRNDRGTMYSCHLYENADRQGKYIKLNGYLIVINKVYGLTSPSEDNATIIVQ